MIADASRSEILSLLRESVADVRPRDVRALGFGVADVDTRLADRGLDGAALHEVAPATASLSDDAAATLFVAGVAARFPAASEARVLWVVSRFDLYAPGLEQAGLPPGRVLFAEGREDRDVLALMEDALRHGGLAAVVGEVRRADMTATRRLQLAADAGRTPALLSRRWRRQGVCPLSELPDQPPRRFAWRGRLHSVVAGDGPERIHGEWWRREGELWAVRDYFRVEDETGARFWVFRRGDGIDPETGDLSWHMHGLFG